MQPLLRYCRRVAVFVEELAPRPDWRGTMAGLSALDRVRVAWAVACQLHPRRPLPPPVFCPLADTEEFARRVCRMADAACDRARWPHPLFGWGLHPDSTPEAREMAAATWRWLVRTLLPHPPRKEVPHQPGWE